MLIGKSNGLALLSEAAAQFLKHPATVERACAAMAALCLRNPANAEELLQANGANVLVRALTVHRDTHPKLLKQACMAIRNVVSRLPSSRAAILGEGAESILRAVRYGVEGGSGHDRFSKTLVPV